MVLIKVVFGVTLDQMGLMLNNLVRNGALLCKLSPRSRHSSTEVATPSYCPQGHETPLFEVVTPSSCPHGCNIHLLKSRYQAITSKLATLFW